MQMWQQALTLLLEQTQSSALSGLPAHKCHPVRDSSNKVKAWCHISSGGPGSVAQGPPMQSPVALLRHEVHEPDHWHTQPPALAIKSCGWCSMHAGEGKGWHLQGLCVHGSRVSTILARWGYTPLQSISQQGSASAQLHLRPLCM